MSAFWAKTSEETHFGSLSWTVASLCAGFAAFVVYLATLAPTVGTNDAGRFQVAAPLLGTGHPTGYPTFIVLGHLFTYLPFGDVAYRVNLMAACFGALAMALFVLVAREAGARLLPAVGAAMFFAWSATFWSQATLAEVYTMNLAFILGVFLLMLRWRREGGWLLLALAALIYGVSLGNNAGMVLLTPAYLVLLVSGWRKEFRVRPLLGAGAAFLLGFSVYLYVPIRGFAGAWHNYGDPVRTWWEVWRLMTGARFSGLMAASSGEFLEGSGRFLVGLASQAYGVFGVVIGGLLIAGGVWGAGVLLARDRAVGVSFLVGIACTLLYAVSYQIDDIAVYYIPVYLFLALLCAVAASDLAGRHRVLSLLAAVPLVVAGFLLGVNYEVSDRSGDYVERKRSEATLAGLPEGSVLYGKVEIVPMTYLTEVEERREDVTLRWLDGGTQREFMARDVRSGRPVYLISDPRYNKEYLPSTEPYATAIEEGGRIRLLPDSTESG